MNKKLVNYIQEQLKRGFDLHTIKNYLVSYGYQEYEIDGAINEIYRPKEINHIIHFSPVTLITIISLFLGLVAAVGIIFFNNQSTQPESLLDLNLKLLSEDIKLGDEINFIVEILNIGSSRRYDIFLKHELINLKNNNVIAFQEETIAIETSASKQRQIKIPETADSGNYMLRTIATYGSERAVSTLQIFVQNYGNKSEVIATECTQDQTEYCEDGLIITKQRCINGIFQKTNEKCLSIEKCESDITQKCNDGKIITIQKCINRNLQPTNELCKIDTVSDNLIEGLSSYEAIEKIKEISKTDREKAAGLCTKLPLETSRDLCFENIAELTSEKRFCDFIIDERTKDICLKNLAKLLRNSRICEQVLRENMKDSCYMDFVVEFHDYSVCDYVINTYLKQSCNSLKQLSELNQTNIAFYESLINQTLLNIPK